MNALRQWILAALLLILALAGIAVWLGFGDQADQMAPGARPAGDVPSTPSGSAEVESPGEIMAAPEAEHSGTTRESAPMPARAGKPSVQVAEPSADPPPRTVDEDLLQTYLQVADSVRHGDTDNAIELARLLDYCQTGFRSAEQIRRELDSVAGKASWDGPPMVIRGEMIKFDSYEQYAAYLWRRHDQCAALQSAAGKALNRDIRSAADSGDAVARYVYAMWPPSDGYDSAGALLEYHERALEYTWQNIRAGEPLGLLALGQSYAQGGTQVLFTPRNPRLGQIFLVAAAKCGLSHPWLDQEVDLIIRRLDTPNPAGAAALAQLNDASDEIRKLYCG